MHSHMPSPSSSPLAHPLPQAAAPREALYQALPANFLAQASSAGFTVGAGPSGTQMLFRGGPGPSPSAAATAAPPRPYQMLDGPTPMALAMMGGGTGAPMTISIKPSGAPLGASAAQAAGGGASGGGGKESTPRSVDVATNRGLGNASPLTLVGTSAQVGHSHETLSKIHSKVATIGSASPRPSFFPDLNRLSSPAHCRVSCRPLRRRPVWWT